MNHLVRICDKTLNLALRIHHQAKGSTAVEYALIVGLIALVIVAALTLIGADIGNKLNTAANYIE